MTLKIKCASFCSKTGNINTSMSAAPKLALVPAKYNKVPIFARKPWDINTAMFAAPKLALVPASRYYCDVT